MDIKGMMTKKVAGIPVLYLVALFVAVLAFAAWKMKPTPEPAPADTTGDTSGDPTGDTVPTFVANPSPTYSTGVPANGAPVSVDDNDKWTRRAIEWLIGQGISTPSVATNAIQKYIAGEQLSQAEGKLRDAAIKQFGLPPELPTGGGTDIPAPVPPTPTPSPGESHIPPAYHTVKGSSDDSWTEVAKLYYKRSDGTAIDLLQSYNVRLHSPFKPGTRIWVPVWTEPRFIKATATMRTTTDIIKKNPPLNSVAMLQSLNDGMRFPVKVGTRVRVA